jgi:hypothetical protein
MSTAEKAAEHGQEFLDSIELCLAHGLFVPALVLFYSAIDGLAWLCMPADKEEVTRDDFVGWVDTYLVPGSDLPCDAWDLYAARCALLHSGTSSSRLSKNAKACEVFYRIDDSGETLVRLPLDAPRLPKWVGLIQLIEALRKAMERFKAAIHSDESLEEVVADRVAHLFEKVRYVP